MAFNLSSTGPKSTSPMKLTNMGWSMVAPSSTAVSEAVRNLYVGGNEIADVKVGSTDVNEIYVGSTLVWSRI